MTENLTQDAPVPDFLANGGEIGTLIGAHDWSSTSLGPPGNWPGTLKSALATLLSCPQPIFIAWGPQLLSFFNDAYRPMLGARLEGAIGRPFAELWSEAWPDLQPIVAKALGGQGSSHEKMPLTLTRNGYAEATWWSFSYMPLRDDRGAVAGMYCISVDVTQQVQAEIALRETNSALDQRTSELLSIETALRQSQKLEALGQLTGGVAHDFNNLLAVISSSVELLRSDKLSQAQHVKYLNLIFDTVARAVKLTSQLLAFARQQPLSPEVFNVHAHVQGVVDLVRPLMGSQMQIRHERSGENDCFAEADISQFEAALVNLAINARDAMNATGQLTIRVQKVDSVPPGMGHGPRPGGFVAIAVADTGCGIAAGKLQAIFEPFYTTKEVGKGTGLGLSQVFGFAKQSGGEVEVSSELGVGSVFTLYLPCAESAPASQAMAPPPNSGRAGNGMRLLVVEDNETLAEMTCEILNALGCQATWAANASAALALLAKGAGQFDLLFSDVVMPGMNGIELGEQVRQHYPGLPVILTSGYNAAMAEDGTHGFELITKPYTSDTLLRIFRRAMAGQRAQPGAPS
ncbi:PAS domain-containing sensor histidine kinase [Polaromonas glacialis]|uniref:PAS domain-containing sensor histidine kinase n=1 Tax=Polaromonas glacialis TaxID=866564 RepID=UPI00068A7B14|nr:PAS domain-containing sensor histidine kinase [Polaromonas glacialis]